MKGRGQGLASRVWADGLHHGASHFQERRAANRPGAQEWTPIVTMEEAMREPPVAVSPAGARLMHAMGEERFGEEFADIAGENHTGNHYRTKNVAVPTAAGEPARG